jgi:quercetin dioxygenase-like cupin family protein
MRTLQVWLGLLCATLLTAGPGAAQDAVKTAPNVYRMVTDNPRVRVLEANFKPGDKVAVHSHPDHLFYMLSEGTLVLKPVGRTPYEMTLKSGEALFLPAQTRGAENDGDKTVRALIVEFKTAAPTSSVRRGTKAKRKATVRGRGKGKRPARPRRR